MPLRDSMFEKLEIGISKKLLVRTEEVGLGLGIRLLYASDLHLRKANRGRVVEELKGVLSTQNPDILLLGGDLVDDRASLKALEDLVQFASIGGVVGGVWGNHDILVGRERIRGAVLESGGHWLQDQALEYGDLDILGRPSQKRRGRKAVLCSHYPTDFTIAIPFGIELVLAGHLHGWQIVLAQKGEYLYPGAWLSRWNGLRFERGASTLLVSRGMTDLLPLRWNCPREVILACL